MRPHHRGPGADGKRTLVAAALLAAIGCGGSSSTATGSAPGGNVPLGNDAGNTDAGTPDAGPPAASSGLNAGAITVADGAAAAGSVTLNYGPFSETSSLMGYRPVSGDVQFFAGGDPITAAGAGGADLPAFPLQTVIAPSDITVTSPACTPSGCPALDRAADLNVAWTGGGAGKVFFTYETLSPSHVAIVSCQFDAAGGTGTVPAALLGHLEKAGDPGIAGVFAIGVTNEGPSFLVGDTPTKLEVQGSGLSGFLTISN